MRAIVVIAASVVACGLALGVARAEPAAPPAPRKVVVGIYVNHVYGLDIKGGQFNVDFYIWFRWEGGDDFKPLDSFELANGRITSKSGIVKKTFGTQSYASARVLATIQKFWDLHRYPFDDHTLAIEVEDSNDDTRTAIFEPDIDNSALSPDLQVPGWEVSGSRAHAAAHTYHTNYGDISLAHNRESAYSRFVYEIDVERPGYGRFLKVFFGLFIAVLISWCGFWVRPKESSPRVSLGVGATFAAAAVTVAINNSLPDTNSVTMADKLIMLTLGIIIAAVAETVVALALVAHGKDSLQKRLDRICAFGFPLFYVVMLAVIIW